MKQGEGILENWSKTLVCRLGDKRMTKVFTSATYALLVHEWGELTRFWVGEWPKH